MNKVTDNHLALWLEARTRFVNQLFNLNAEKLSFKLSPSPNSVGFLLRHIGDVEFLFAKNVFGSHDLKVSAKTIIDKHDTGEWTDLNELVEYLTQSGIALSTVITNQSEDDWQTVVVTKEFGSKTKSEALGRIVSHTAYHAGQMALILKYGK
jgi:uncharacterized damage-inducible protein DinB